jgi:phosphoribosylformimino-5-aminoimidazole carboxamide ribotide isomerase
MNIIPVLDVLRGQVVRGVGGRREEYRPVASRLTTSTAPLDVARAFREHFGLTLLYVADLDAIVGGVPSIPLYRSLQDDAFHLWVDAGIRRAGDALALAEADVSRIVAGLETLTGPEVLRELVTRFGADRIVFSLDLKEGRPHRGDASWNEVDPLAIAGSAISAGVRRMIVLDLARVGMNDGTGTEEVCSRIAARHPEIEIIAGGGVRDKEDIVRLSACGVGGVLVASVLHDGQW